MPTWAHGGEGGGGNTRPPVRAPPAGTQEDWGLHSHSQCGPETSEGKSKESARETAQRKARGFWKDKPAVHVDRG